MPLKATVWLDLLVEHIRPEQHFDVRRKDGTLALQVSGMEAVRLARYGMVAGHISGGILRYLILRVPKSAIVRVLHADPPRSGEISRPQLPGMHTFQPDTLDVRYCKLGRIGRPARSTCWMWFIPPPLATATS